MQNCLHPIILNKEGKYRNIQLHSYKTLVVPCNECENCRQNRSLDFTIRAYYDYLWFNSDAETGKKGFVMFDTLTFDNEHLPTYRLHGEDIPCFSAENIRDFKSMFERKAISLLFYLRKLPRNPHNRTLIRTEVRRLLKTIIVSEYGSEHHRPHYHILVFNKIPEFTPALVERLYMDSWIDEDYHMLGGVEDISPNLKVIEGLGKIIYVSGYVNKDEEFYRGSLKEKIKNLPRTEQNRFIPRNYIYRGFGKHILDYFTEKELLNPDCKLKLPNGENGFSYESVPPYILNSIIKDTCKKEIQIGEKKKVAVPLYPLYEGRYEYVDKYVYTTKTMYFKRLNDKGVSYYVNKFSKRHKKLVDDLNNLLQNGKNYTALGYLKPKNFEESWSYCMDRSMRYYGITVYQLATYMLLYRGRYGSVNPFTCQSRPMHLSDFKRQVRNVFTSKYYTSESDIDRVYGTGEFSNSSFNSIVKDFLDFNRHLLALEYLKKVPLRDAIKRQKTKNSKNRKLKFY